MAPCLPFALPGSTVWGGAASVHPLLAAASPRRAPPQHILETQAAAISRTVLQLGTTWQGHGASWIKSTRRQMHTSLCTLNVVLNYLDPKMSFSCLGDSGGDPRTSPAPAGASTPVRAAAFSAVWPQLLASGGRSLPSTCYRTKIRHRRTATRTPDLPHRGHLGPSQAWCPPRTSPADRGSRPASGAPAQAQVTPASHVRAVPSDHTQSGASTLGNIVREITLLRANREPTAADAKGRTGTRPALI